MLALKIIDIKEFMNKLLIKDIFDQFEVIESTITTFCTFSITGKYQKDFFDSEIQKNLEENHYNYVPWKEIKPYCFSIIRGKRTPLQFKLIFQLPHKEILSLLNIQQYAAVSESISGLFLNIHFKNNELYCTTGISFQTFVPDNSVKYLWDSYIINLFHNNQILFEEL